MAKNKLNLHELSDSDLKQYLDEEVVRMKKIKFQHAVTPVENPSLIRKTRRNIARYRTEMKSRTAQTESK